MKFIVHIGTLDNVAHFVPDGQLSMPPLPEILTS